MRAFNQREQRNSVDLQLVENTCPANRLTCVSSGKILAADARGNVMALPPKFSPNYSTSEPPRRLKNSLSLFVELHLYHIFSLRFCQEQSSTFTYIIDGRDVKVLDRLRGLRYTGGLSISASSSSEFELPLRRAPTSRRNNEGLLFLNKTYISIFFNVTTDLFRQRKKYGIEN